MTYGESNGHVNVIDDVTWPRKVKVMTTICLGSNRPLENRWRCYSATIANYLYIDSHR